jgi:hypothetical protein
VRGILPNPRGSWGRIGLILLLPILFASCLADTVGHLWATRSQFLDFDRNLRFEASTAQRGPGLRFLDPRLSTKDVLAVASGRKATSIVRRPDGETWVFRYLRRPTQKGKAVTLELDFRHGLLERIGVDRRFSEQLGDERIHMLIRQFVGPNTELNLLSGRVVCKVPKEELRRFPPLTRPALVRLLGEENLVREVKLRKGDPKHIFRYKLAGTPGEKGAMSFGASFDDLGALSLITSRIGSFSLEFDLSGVR